jgi:16S rRNA (cytidine1402-2'-O)-methyltransferase
MADGKLYVVATPIGHLDDLSPRAAATLRDVPVLAAEDTRVSGLLHRHVGSKAELLSAHAHNEPQAAQRILARLAAGESVALVSDAGTPAISDPGAIIVAAAHEAGVAVVPIPGPSAAIALLSAAGLSAGSFLFGGFLPPKPAARRARLAELGEAAARAGASVVLYEAPHRIRETLQDVSTHFDGDRLIAIGRELTKTFEEVHRCRCGEVLAWLDERPTRLRGEFVIAIDRAPESSASAAITLPGWASEPRSLLQRLLLDLSPSRAVRLAGELTGWSHRDLYAMALELADESVDPETEGSEDPPAS